MPSSAYWQAGYFDAGGDEFTGYDYDSNGPLVGNVNGAGVMIFDNNLGQYFHYSVG